MKNKYNNNNKKYIYIYPDEITLVSRRTNANYIVFLHCFPLGKGVGGGGVMVVGGLRDRVDLHSLELINIAFARGYQKVLSFRICSTHT